MNQMKISLLILTAAFAAGCAQTNQSKVEAVKNELRAPAYPLVTIDPYTSAWSFTDHLYDESVRHWTGEKFPLIGAIRVDGQVYRFLGTEETPMAAVAKTAEAGGWTGRYSHVKPGEGWEKPDFDDRPWQEGPAAFGTTDDVSVQTPWTGDHTEIWVRREIVLDEDLSGKKVFLEYSHDDDFVLYVNGIEVVRTGEGLQKNVYVPVPDKVLQTLKAGRNVFAAHCRNHTGGALVDFGLHMEAPVRQYLETAAVQKSVDVQATQTHYLFACGPVDLQLTFTAPLLMHDLELISRPVNYLSYEVTPTDGATHQVEIYFEASPLWALDKSAQESRSETFEKDGLVFLKTGSASQRILEKGGDNVRIDWGYFYLCAEKSNATCTTGDEYALRESFGSNGLLETAPAAVGGHDKLALAQSLGAVGKPASGKIMIGYDDLYSIQYFGDNLRPYWNDAGNRSIESVFAQANQEYEKLKTDCDRFDYELITNADRVGGKEYAGLCALAYRQAVAAHKLVKAPNGDLLFLSKENFSNGSIGTVDVTYPSSPLFLLYNTELAKGLLNHIFYFSESGKWTKPFAAHDVGTYPRANGQTYGGDMPVEESGNMLILTAAIAVREGNAAYAEKHWATLTTWTDYLVEKGLDPENQLCTDDFAGHFAHNANLSVKAILGIASYGHLAGMLGKKDIAEKYTAQARSMAAEWMKMADDGDHYRLTFDQPGTWSQKYNLVWNKLLKLGIFPETVAEKEVPYYLTVQHVYGLPLDNRKTYTKSDWIIWTATLAQEKETFEQFVRPVYRFMNETTDRIPMSDWYYTDSPKHVGFQARSVIGGYFIKMLEENLR
ncbi:MAG: DUF4965 domain-containing protein [Tannerella sp.]|jgi:hypothetical protein|nr:DUF4965 domain-containing protein [Tannerella sp.]